jgi:carbamoyl-phosphate synthase large subunit
MKKYSLTIAVTGMNAIDSPGPGIGVIRALRDCQDFNLRIIGLSYEALEPGIYMHDIVDKSYQIPYPSAGSSQLMDRIKQINANESIDVVIPNFDAELSNFIRLGPELKKMGIHSFLPSLKKMEEVDKMHLADFGKKHGFEVPETKFISSAKQIQDIEETFDYPLVVKGRYYDAYIARNQGQVTSYFHNLNARWGLPVVIQEFVEGIEIDIVGLGNGKGKLIGAIPLRKLFITDKGKGWSGVVLEDNILIDLAHKFAASSEWAGGFEMELMRTKEEKFYIMEINPRFPAWVYTAAAAGQNLPALLVKLALGEDVTPFESYQAGKMFVRYSWDLITDISEFQQINTMGEL